jgi:hypothetical protein
LRPNGLEHREVTAARGRPQTFVLEDRSQGLAGGSVFDARRSSRAQRRGSGSDVRRLS